MVDAQGLIFGMTTGTFAGKLALMGVVALLAWAIQHAAVGFSRRVLDAAEVPFASILVNVERGLIWSFALLAVLQPVFGVEPTGFVAAIGVTSVALSLGLQDTISNLIGGLSLMVSRVIVPGDVVCVGSFTGVVTDITWRATTLMARGGNVEVIPNSVLSKSAFTKLTEGAAAACPLTFVVRADAEAATVEREACQAAIRAAGELADPARPPIVRFANMDAYGITVTLTTFLAPGAKPADLNDRVSRALAGMPWLARAV